MTPSEFALAHGEDALLRLVELLRIPSVSAVADRAPDIRRAAEWVAGRLRRLGLATELIETEGHPLVYAESPPVPGAPTVLVYGHYDVQPVDPLDEWLTPPFEPAIRGDDLFARGASDDKGQIFMHIKAVEAYLKAAGRLPVPGNGRRRAGACGGRGEVRRDNLAGRREDVRRSVSDQLDRLRDGAQKRRCLLISPAGALSIDHGCLSGRTRPPRASDNS